MHTRTGSGKKAAYWKEEVYVKMSGPRVRLSRSEFQLPSLHPSTSWVVLSTILYSLPQQWKGQALGPSVLYVLLSLGLMFRCTRAMPDLLAWMVEIRGCLIRYLIPSSCWLSLSLFHMSVQSSTRTHLCMVGGSLRGGSVLSPSLFPSQSFHWPVSTQSLLGMRRSLRKAGIQSHPGSLFGHLPADSGGSSE